MVGEAKVVLDLGDMGKVEICGNDYEVWVPDSKLGCFVYSGVFDTLTEALLELKRICLREYLKRYGGGLISGSRVLKEKLEEFENWWKKNVDIENLLDIVDRIENEV